MTSILPFSPSALVLSIALSAIAFTPAANAQDKKLKWTDHTGKHTIEAELVSFDGEQVVLRKKDGKNVTLPLEKLSPESQSQAKKSAKPPSTKRSDRTVPNKPSERDGEDAAVIEFPADIDAKTFVDIVVSEIQKKNPIVIWDALPESKQQDVEAIVQKAAKKIDSRTFDLVRRTRDKAMDVLKSKQQFILGNSVFPFPETDKYQAEKSYPAFVSLVESYLSKELLDPKRLQKGNLRGLLLVYFKDVATKADALGATLPPDHPMRVSLDASAPIVTTVEQSTQTDASVVATVNDQPVGNFELIYKQSRWQPIELVKQWDPAIDQINLAIQKMEPEAIQQGLTVVVATFVAPVLGNLKNAKNQQEFDDVLRQLQSQLQALPIPGVPPPGGLAPGGQPQGF